MIHKPLANIELRGSDETGNGWYGANRGRRKHKGLDLVSIPNEAVFSPIHGIITKIGYPYAKALQFRYIEITGPIYRVWLMYVLPNDSIKKGQKIFIGDKVGTAQNIAEYHHPEMQNHIHLQVWKYGLLTDPEPILFY